MVILISLATFVSTLIGGLFALKFRDKLHLILGFSAGALVGVAFFDLMPEALEIGQKFYHGSTITAAVAGGFVLYLLLDRTIFLHFHEHEHTEGEQELEHHHIQTKGELSRGRLGAGSLSIHSFLDGVAIGLAFQVSGAIGTVVAAAVLTHDFSDGINTVNFILKHRGEKNLAFKWLLVDALAPVIGAASTLLFTLPENVLCIILAMFSGFFLYIGASDLIPESHHNHPKFMTTAMTILGVLTLYVVIRIANI